MSPRRLLISLLIAAGSLALVAVARNGGYRRFPDPVVAVAMGVCLGMAAVATIFAVRTPRNLTPRVCGVAGCVLAAAILLGELSHTTFAQWRGVLLLYVAIIVVPLLIARHWGHATGSDGGTIERGRISLSTLFGLTTSASIIAGLIVQSALPPDHTTSVVWFCGANAIVVLLAVRSASVWNFGFWPILPLFGGLAASWACPLEALDSLAGLFLISATQFSFVAGALTWDAHGQLG